MPIIILDYVHVVPLVLLDVNGSKMLLIETWTMIYLFPVVPMKFQCISDNAC